MLPVTIVFLSLFASFYCLDVFVQSECGHTKSCLRWSRCNFPTCDYGVSWKAIEYNSKNYVEIEIVGSVQNSSYAFIAFGFSLTNKMMDNGVVTCRINDGNLFISCGHNSIYNNKLFDNSSIDSDFLITSKGTLYGVEFDSTQNMLRCRFLRLVTPTLLKDDLKDLNSELYYLLSSKGVSNSATRLSYHRQNRRVSSSSYNITSSYRVSLITTYLLVKVHACFMIIGWILFATNGIFIAYFYKNNWPKKQIFGEKLWFQFHRLLQCSCVLCVVIGFIVIFVNVQGYSALGSLPNSAHPVMGIIATSLLLINPIIALFRCQPNSESRWIFNTMHLIVGTSAYVFALTAMSIGIQMPPAGPLLSSMSYPYIIVIAFLVGITFLFCAEVLRKWYRTGRIGINDSAQSYSGNLQNDEQNQETLLQKLMAGAKTYNIIIDSVLASTIITIVLITIVIKF